VNERSGRSVAFIGLGKMGSPIADHLCAAGVEVRPFDIDPRALRAFCDRTGSPSYGSAAEAAEGTSIAMTILPTSASVETALFGPGGVLQARTPPPLIVDLTSGEPGATRAFDARLAERNIAIVDAPVSGGVAKAATGDVAVMVGGDVADVERAMWVLEIVGRSVRHIGSLGSGQAMKSLNNLVSAGGLLIAAEAISVAAKFGLDPERVVDVLNESTGMNNATKNKFKPFVLSGRFDSGFGLDLMVKDLSIALGIARSLDADTPFSETCLAICRDIAAELGPGRDHTEVAKVASRRAGFDISVSGG